MCPTIDKSIIAVFWLLNSNQFFDAATRAIDIVWATHTRESDIDKGTPSPPHYYSMESQTSLLLFSWSECIFSLFQLLIHVKVR